MGDTQTSRISASPEHVDEPRFCVIIGAMKCATTSLFDALSTHPACTGGTVKEPNLFLEDRYWESGALKYGTLFPSRSVRGGYLLDGSTRYTKAPAIDTSIAARRMADSNLDIRLIYIVRDPIERIASHLRHQIDQGIVRYEERFRHLNLAVSISRYAWQLDRFLNHYRNANLHIETFEALTSGSQAPLSHICRFLDIECDTELSFPRSYQSSADSRLLELLSETQRNRLREMLLEDVIGFRRRYAVDTSMWKHFG